jgi:cytochrome bd ubiquinol oxidase subunit I
MLLAFAGLLFLLLSAWRRDFLYRRAWLTFVAFLTPLGFLAVEAGWTVTEVGRQPWIIYGVMKTKDAVSTMPGLQYSFYTISAVYLLLTALLIWLMRRQIATVPEYYPSAASNK